MIQARRLLAIGAALLLGALSVIATPAAHAAGDRCVFVRMEGYARPGTNF